MVCLEHEENAHAYSAYIKEDPNLVKIDRNRHIEKEFYGFVYFVTCNLF